MPESGTGTERPHSGRARVIFCGSRRWMDRRAIRLALEALSHMAVIVHGGARGATPSQERRS
ncbi:MAG: DUF2493 domain-containing protein [Chloroflexota bacterium]|nr:DUF2493 domain-containing protein [Chloroflexota bacterium]